MGHIGNKLIYPAPFTRLAEDGFLVRGRYFFPYFPNLRGITKSAGDFNAKELGKRATDDKELTANAAKVWAENLRGKSTLCYAVSIGHAEVLRDALRGAGARVELVTANTKDGLRRDYIGGLERGALDVLVSVGVLTTGVDLPSLKALLICRPTESYNLHIQILGRATRTFPGKKYFLVYDLAGNVQKHGPIEAEPTADLNGMPVVPKIKLTMCSACYAAFESGPDTCPCCGDSLAQAKERVTGERIHGLTDNSEVIEWLVQPWEIDLPHILSEAKARGFRKGWCFNVIKGKYGEEIATKAWPRIRAAKKWPVKTHKTA